jgi:hypothetical protein
MTERPWLRGAAWLVFLGPLFFVTYNFANWFASTRAQAGWDVGSIVFPWEAHLPFLAWTIVPYWSSDLLYALSFAICRTRQEVDLQGKRLLAIQLFSVASFLAFPLRCTFVRPAVDGLPGKLFSALESFDLPFNQAPSLHVALAVILWARYRNRTGGLPRTLLAAWFALVAVSPWTTYQHHFIDIVTGAWAGLLTLAAFPEKRVTPPIVGLASGYLSGAVFFTAGAFAMRGFGWLLLWPAFALSMVAAAYWTGDAAWFTSRLLMAPYTAVAWINSRLWTRAQPAKNHLAGPVWIGRAPFLRDRDGMHSVTLAPELQMRGDESVAMLDLAPPTCEQLEDAVGAITKLGEKGPTLVCCALGYSRAAIASAAWLIAAGRARTAADAVEQVRRARPQVVLRAEYLLRLDQWAESRMSKVWSGKVWSGNVS